MGDYVEGKTARGGVSNVNVSQNVDVDAIAKAVAAALGKISIRGGGAGTGDLLADGFSDEKSMEALAKAMVVQRGKNESNFENLGGVKETKKDQKAVDKTIALLSNLDD